MAPKRGLGKGLSALLPPGETPLDNNAAEIDENPESSKAPPPSRAEKAKQGEILISPDRLKANPNQPRKVFDEEELSELAESIKQHGIIQPIIAEDGGDGTYTIIAGERRTRAARLAGLKEVPVILRKYSGDKQMEVSLIENIQRANLNPIEEASAYRQLMDQNKLSQDDVASRVGKNRATVANSLRLLRLPREMQESIQRGEISPGHARAILSITGAATQESLFREIIKKGLSVREAEKRALSLGNQNKKNPKLPLKGRAPELAAMEEKFITRLGTKVVVNGDLNKGNIVIDYYSMEDLDRLYEILGG